MAKKILLADDSITIQKVVELTFSDGDYEVIAVNNGAKAIQKLAEMRPDIILSDIIMPEKNGYEVCEYVKSHPEFRNIPVVLLTGTFEPFDPDRADKAGCDAVVTKPFESQSLIHKVEELIEQSRSHAAPAAIPTPVVIPEPTATPWDDAPAAPPTRPAGFNVGGFSAEPAYQPPAFNAPAASDPFATTTFQSNNNDIFGAAPAATTPATTEMPFEPPVAPAFGNDEPIHEPSYGGETRAFPRMSFDELQASAQNNTPPAAIEPSPWDEAAAPQTDFSGETRAFPQMSYDDLQRMATPHVVPEVHHEPSIEPAPWDEPAASPAFASGETRAFPQVGHEELQQFAPHQEAPAYQPQHEAEPAPWDQPESEHAFGGETQAFPRLTYEQLQQAGAPHVAAPAEPSWMQQAVEPEPVSQHETPAHHEPEVETSPWAQQDTAQAESAPWDSEPAPDAAPWGQEQPAFDHEEPVYGGETRAFPRLSAEEMQQMAAGQHAAAPTPAVEPEPAPWEEPPTSAVPQWPPTDETSSALEVDSVDSFTSDSFNSDSFSGETASPFAQPMEESPFDDTAIASGPGASWSPAEAAPPQQQYEPQAEQHEQFAAAPAPEPEELSHATVAYQSPMHDTTAPQYFAAHEPEPAVAPAPAQSASTIGDLSDEQVDRIARRVVQLMSEQVVKNIAWEVIPDLAEIVVKERIRQLESEA